VAEGAVVPHAGRRVVATTWAVAGAVHLWIALDAPTAGIAGAVVSAVLAVVAVIGAVALVLVGRPEALMAAIVAGALGVAGYLIPMVAGLPGFGDLLPSWDNPWPFVAFLLDALVVRIALFTLRRTTRTQTG
jgi:hypothetical protein